MVRILLVTDNFEIMTRGLFYISYISLCVTMGTNVLLANEIRLIIITDQFFYLYLLSLTDILPANGFFHPSVCLLCPHPIEPDLPVLDTHKGKGY